MESSERRSIMEKEEKNELSATVEEPVTYRGWKSMPYIIGNETCEKLGAIGTLANLLVYLTTVFNMSNIAAATILNVFNGTTNFATLIGAFVSDTYWGRFKTIGLASISSFLGLLLMDFTAVFKNLHPPHCAQQGSPSCKGPTNGQVAFLFSGLALLIVGASGIRPCNFAFGADQFNPNTESGKKGINSFFNWYFFTFTVAQMISLTIIVYVQTSISWSLGLGLPAILMFFSVSFYFMGAKLYVKVKASGSPMTSVAQVIVVAFKKRRLKQPEEPWLSIFVYTPPNSFNSKLPYTHQFRSLDKAAVVNSEDQINPDGSAANPWQLCSMQQVEEVKCLVRVLPIWSACVMYYVGIAQIATYGVFQATQSDTRLKKFEIPAGSFPVFQMLAMTIWIPIYDRLVVPFLQKRTGKEGGITILQRMGIGIVFSVLSIVVSGIVEEHRRSVALTRPVPGIRTRGDVSSISAFWLIPQFVLAGLAEAFTAIGQVEFYYKQFPENMRSIAGSLFFCGMACASYLSGFFITVINRATKGAATGNWLPEDLNQGRLEYFYYMIAAIGVLNFVYFLVCAKWYKYKGAGIENTLEVEVVKSEQPEKTVG